MPESIKQTEIHNQPVQDEFFFPDDPRRYDAYREEAEKKLKAVFEDYSIADIVDFIETEVIEKMCESPVLTDLLGLSNDAIASYPSLVFATIFSNKKIFDAIKSHPQPRQLETRLLPVVRKQLTYSLDIGKTRAQNGPVTIVAADHFKYISAWYSHRAFSNLEQTVGNLKAVEKTEEREKEAFSLAVLGFMYGEFSPENPNAAHNRRALAPFLPNELPAILRQHIPEVRTAENETTRLALLKTFWHEAFITSFVAAKRISQTTSASLNPADLLHAQQRLPRDTRVAEMRSGAIKLAETRYARTRNTTAAQNIVSEYDRESHDADQIAIQQKKKLLSLLNNILSSYNPNHVPLLDESGIPVHHWNIFRSKCGRIFEVCAQSTSRLHAKDISPIEVESILALTLDRLVAVLKTGNETNTLDPVKLFGADFLSLQPIEAVSLIIFSALAMAKPSDRPEHTIQAFSYQLQPILNKHQIEAKYPPSAVQPLPITHPDFAKQAGKAVTTLFSLKMSDGLISVYDTELDAKLTNRTETLKEYNKIIKTAKEVGEGKSHWIRQSITFFNLIMLGTLMSSLGNSTGEILSGEPIDDPLRQLLSYMWLLFVTALNYLPQTWLINVRPGNAVKTTKMLRETEIMGDDFFQQLRKVDLHLHQNVANLREFLAAVMLISLGIGFGLKIADNLGVLDPIIERAISLFEQESDVPPIISLAGFEGFINRFPETFPEEIDYTNDEKNPTIKTATILHLPPAANYQDGDPVLFLANQSANRYGIPTSTSIQPFQEIKPITNHAEMAENAMDHEYVFEVTNSNHILYPPDGHRIVRLYLNDPAPDIKIDTLGRILLRKSAESVVIVTEPLPAVIHDANQAIVEYEGHYVIAYQPWEGWFEKYQEALDLNHELSPDPALQSLHLAMVNEINALVATFNTGSLTDNVMRDLWSDIALDYTIRLSDYLQSTRTYSLRTMQLNNDHPYASLIEIASEPDLGYACTVANVGYAEFMASINVQVQSKSGKNTMKFGNGLYSRGGHLNSLLYLPNGRIINVDFTPQTETPGEDFSSQDIIPPITEDDDEKNRTLKNLGLFTLALAGAGVIGYGVKKYKSRPIWTEFQTQLEASTPEENEVAQAVVSAAEHILVYLLYTADDQIWEKSGLTQHFQDQTEFYSRLAQDALTFLKPEELSPPDLQSEEYTPARISPRFISQISKLDLQQKTRIRDGIKLVRRALQTHKKDQPEQVAFVKSLSNFLKTILVYTR